MKTKGKVPKWKIEGFDSFASYLDAKLKERGATSTNKNYSLVCIANVETGEVLRINSEEAYINFVNKKNGNWYFTTKFIYKRYIKSLRPGSLQSAPKFKLVVDRNGRKVIELVNVLQ